MVKLNAAIICLTMGLGLHAADSEYRVVREIYIGGEGGWDYVIGDPETHRLYVSHATKIVVADTETGTFNHTGGSITAFDPMTGAVMATIGVGGELEEAVEDPAANRVFVNVEDKGSIAVVDTLQHETVTTWKLAGCDGPTGLAFDAQNHLLFSACDGVMAVVDSQSGRSVASFPIGQRVDGNGFDPVTRLVFASSGTGVMTVAHQDAPDKYTVVQTVQTQASGRTMWLDPVSHRVYVPAATTTPVPNGRPQVTPDTFKVLVLEGR
jgi:DNA-binding beta-propeller fold protein YncE